MICPMRLDLVHFLSTHVTLPTLPTVAIVTTPADIELNLSHGIHQCRGDEPESLANWT